ncbi:MAG: hypothetical protein BGO12_17195 [Verrucomicrobia bacterium 61-8]|nr:MAG: hypothetical protein BGO12_17195 [Verrucomicrobia bacterium 61-8]
MKPLGELILGSLEVESEGVFAFSPPFANLEFQTPKIIGIFDGISSEKLENLGFGFCLGSGGGFVGDAFIGR